MTEKESEDLTQQVSRCVMRSHQRRDLGENINGQGPGQRHRGGKKPAVFSEQTRRRPAGMEPASEEDGTLMHQDKQEPDYG